MNEIEKLYENAGVEKNELYGFHCHRSWDICENEHKCKICKYSELIYGYPPFTAEKQLELIKRFIPSYPLNFTYGFLQAYPFDEGLAHCMNSIWEKFTQKDKQQIKEILE